MPTDRTVSADCSPMCKLLDGPTRRRQMPSICICGHGALCGFTPMSEERLASIADYLDSNATLINANTARVMFDEIKWLRARVAELEQALQKVSDIRDSIVGMQGFNFSEHAYPLVAVLDGAGFKGKGYEIARKNLGALIEQRDTALRERDEARQKLKLAREEVEHMVADAARLRDDKWKYEAERNAVDKERDSARAEVVRLNTVLDERDDDRKRLLDEKRAALASVAALKAENERQSSLIAQLDRHRIERNAELATERLDNRLLRSRLHDLGETREHALTSRIDLVKENDSLRSALADSQQQAERMRAVYEAAVEWFNSEHTGDANCAAGDCDDCEARTKEGLLRVRIAQSLGREPDWWDLRRAGMPNPRLSSTTTPENKP